ncbi:MAG: hypothetical protein HQP61_01875 [Peptococcaceae bacterium]|nr:hypothetical protein [Candidatus Syntrophopropionicum ammoniitolerans]
MRKQLGGARYPLTLQWTTVFLARYESMEVLFYPPIILGKVQGFHLCHLQQKKNGGGILFEGS